MKKISFDEKHTTVVFTEEEAKVVSTKEKQYQPDMVYCFSNEQLKDIETKIQKTNKQSNKTTNN
jgi:hypothetical protein